MAWPQCRRLPSQKLTGRSSPEAGSWVSLGAVPGLRPDGRRGPCAWGHAAPSLWGHAGCHRFPALTSPPHRSRRRTLVPRTARAHRDGSRAPGSPLFCLSQSSNLILLFQCQVSLGQIIHLNFHLSVGVK